MKRVCYIIEINLSIVGLFERLDDMVGVKWHITGVDDNYMEIEILAPESMIVDVQNEMAFYV